MPLGGVIISDPIYDTFRERTFPGGLTYSGHPLATAAAVATINAMTVNISARKGRLMVMGEPRSLAARHAEETVGPDDQHERHRHE